MRQRLRRLVQEPVCRDCAAKGLFRLASVPDHIIPLSMGGTDDEENIQCLCNECHDKKTRKEFGFREKWTIGLDGWPIE
jgi:5-methylcytosine-specific restriction protein A